MGLFYRAIVLWNDFSPCNITIHANCPFPALDSGVTQDCIFIISKRMSHAQNWRFLTARPRFDRYPASLRQSGAAQTRRCGPLDRLSLLRLPAARPAAPHSGAQGHGALPGADRTDVG